MEARKGCLVSMIPVIFTHCLILSIGDRRLSIGVEIIHYPDAIMIDECTTGITIHPIFVVTKPVSVKCVYYGLI